MLEYFNVLIESASTQPPSAGNDTRFLVIAIGIDIGLCGHDHCPSQQRGNRVQRAKEPKSQRAKEPKSQRAKEPGKGFRRLLLMVFVIIPAMTLASNEQGYTTNSTSVPGGLFDVDGVPGIQVPVDSFIGSGLNNEIQSTFPDSMIGCVLVGGVTNYLDGQTSVLVGGKLNVENGSYSVIVGGQSNQDLREQVGEGGPDYNFIGGGTSNQLKLNSDYSCIVGGDGNVILEGYGAFLGGGRNNELRTNSDYATLVGGNNNTVQSYAGVIGGGEGNSIFQTSGILASFAIIGGGRGNIISDPTYPSASSEAVISGGAYNAARSERVVVSGGAYNSIPSNNSYNVIGGGFNNWFSPGSPYSTISGGYQNNAQAGCSYFTVGGGRSNFCQYTVSGAQYGAVLGGYNNSVAASYASVLGGAGNAAWGAYSAIGGGSANFTSGQYAFVGGGNNNSASGASSFAAGRQAKATQAGCFVWSDTYGTDLTCSGNNNFKARATGGVEFISGYAYPSIPVGVVLPAGAGAWSALSDRAAKTEITPVAPDAILERLMSLDVDYWKYASEESGAWHLGPMAQDFRAAFGLGDADTRISTVDSDGVALASIKALAVRLEDLTNSANAANAACLSGLQARDAEVAALRATVDTLVAEVRLLQAQSTGRAP